MIRTIRLPVSQKLALTALFLLALIDVAFDVIRTVQTLSGSSLSPYTIWDILEPAIAVIICALPTYKTLWGKGNQIKKEQQQRQQQERGQYGRKQSIGSGGGSSMWNRVRRGDVDLDFDIEEEAAEAEADSVADLKNLSDCPPTFSNPFEDQGQGTDSVKVVEKTTIVEVREVTPP